MSPSCSARRRRKKQRDTPHAQAYAARTAKLIESAGRHFNRGQRGFFLALGYLGWFLGPWVLMVTTAAVLFVIAHRQFASELREAIIVRMRRRASGGSHRRARCIASRRSARARKQFGRPPGQPISDQADPLAHRDVGAAQPLRQAVERAQQVRAAARAPIDRISFDRRNRPRGKCRSSAACGTPTSPAASVSPACGLAIARLKVAFSRVLRDWSSSMMRSARRPDRRKIAARSPPRSRRQEQPPAAAREHHAAPADSGAPAPPRRSSVPPTR